MSRDVILTGLRSNSAFHLGNYLGAIKPMTELQARHSDDYQINMFVPDLHSFTTPVDHETIYRQTLDNLKVYVAAGIDINDASTFIYRQSFIPAHSEMEWIISCFTYVGELSRMTQYKEKAGKNPSAGLFMYPVLMIADILLYDAKWVPIGEDQRQHLELTRDVAIRFNNKFGDIFTVPEEWDKQLEFMSLGKGLRIRSLKHPERKMSKSIEDPAGTIILTDNPGEAAKKIMAATTDSLDCIKLDWENQPGISNLLQILSALSSGSIDNLSKEWEGKSNYGELKKVVADKVQAFLTEFQAKLALVDESAMLAKLEADEAVMCDKAGEKLLQVQKVTGLRQSN